MSFLIQSACPTAESAPSTVNAGGMNERMNDPLPPDGGADPTSGALTPGTEQGYENGDGVCASALDLGPSGPPCRKTRRFHASPGPRQEGCWRPWHRTRTLCSHCSCDLIAKERVLSNMPQVLGGCAAASRVSGTSTFFPRRVSFSHSLMFKSECFTSNGHKMEQTCFPSRAGEVCTKPVTRRLRETGLT